MGELPEPILHADHWRDQLPVHGRSASHVKPTDFQAKQVQLSVQFGRGKQAEPAEGMALLAEAVISESGIGKLSREQLAEALSGANVGMEFKVGPESFAFKRLQLEQ